MFFNSNNYFGFKEEGLIVQIEVQLPHQLLLLLVIGIFQAISLFNIYDVDIPLYHII